MERLEFRILERPGTNEPVGYFTHPWYDWDTGLVANHYELKPGVSWLEATPSVARYLWQTGETYSKRDGKPQRPHHLQLLVRERASRLTIFSASACRACATRMPGTSASPTCRPSCACIAPALERPHRRVGHCGYTGERKISFYQLRPAIGAGQRAGWSPSNPGCQS